MIEKKMDTGLLEVVQKSSLVNGPLMVLFNERYPDPREDDPDYKYALEHVQSIGQDIMDLIVAGLL